ncbi:MAG: MG2 domain-containing protein [Prevotella sp.]|nr:MG2 domain-containing protein [Prevotella sp.]
MKRFFLLLTIAAAFAVQCAHAQKGYSTLWKQVNEAEDNDLPKSAVTILRQISERAIQEKAYGHALKAEMKTMQNYWQISADSLKPAVKRLEARMEAADDVVAKAVFAAVLSKAYDSYRTHIADNWETMSQYYAKEAMSSPQRLADVRADDYKPLVVEGYNASVFSGDLLSVIGFETGEFRRMGSYYEKAGNRRAACISALYALMANNKEKRVSSNYSIKKSPYVYSLDSLINVYKDLDVAGEVAVVRYYAMNLCKDNSPEKQITYIHYILDNWPGWQRAGEMRTEERALTNPSLLAELRQHVVRPGEDVTISLQGIRNIKSVYANIYSTTLNGNSGININSAATFKKYKPYIKNLQQPLTVTASFHYHPNYELFNDSLRLQGLPTGIYVVEIGSQPTTKVSYITLFVSDLFLLKQQLPGRQVRYAVVNSTTGKPIADASIEVKLGKEKKTLQCDGNGEVIYTYEKQAPANEYAFTSSDKASPSQNLYSNFFFNNSDGKTKNVKIFTDRSIYRPGQTVHVSAVCYRYEDRITPVADEGRDITIKLLDTNGKTVKEKSLKADKYGTASTDFILPEGRVNGTYALAAGGMMNTIQVEEYKRPSFKVEIPKVNTRYENGDTLMLQGKALSYAGVPVQGARVSYRVERKAAYWWRWSPGINNTTEVLKTAETITDGEGRFDVEMPLVLPEEALNSRLYYNFIVTADVTDISGETRVGTLSVPLGSRTTAISSSLDDKVLADSLSGITVFLKNAAGLDVSTDVRLTVDDGAWLTGQTMRPIMLPQRLSSGEHTLRAICDSDTLVQKFIVFGLDDKVPCVKTNDWFYCSADKFPADGEVTVQAGTSGDTHVFYTVFTGETVIEKGTVDISNQLINFKLKYKKEYGNGIVISFAWVRDGKCYTHTANISRPIPDKRLTLKWTTFRDRLLPGQAEEWKLSVLRPDGKPADARLIATMYDKSLDQLSEHRWSFNVVQLLPLPQSAWRSTFTGIRQLRFMNQSFSDFASHAFEFSRFDPSLFTRYSDNYIRGVKQSLMAKSVGAEKYGIPAAAEHVVMESAVGMKEERKTDSADGEKGYDDSTPNEENIRENMNETAFFYPHLTADKDGTVSLAFTLPETLTSWRVMGVANTPDMMTGFIEGECVAQKEVMVQPNLPRFLRQGDETVLSAKIFNTGNSDIQGTVRMDIIDSETETVLKTESKAFAVKVDKTAVADFNFTPDRNHDLLVIRIVANGKTFSDGEQHYIAVLPDKERVTVTKTFTQTKPGKTTVDLPKLFGVKDKSSRLTVEYTNNPAWMMVQALPSMAQPHDNNAIDQATSLYANTLALFLAKQNPALAKTFEIWKNEKAGEGSLTSSIEKNLELKDIVTSETPWVNEAETETEQKHALAMLFDNNAMSARLSSAADKLAKLQNNDGSWSWWQGMKSNAWMTQEIATVMARMIVMTSADKDNAMLNKALAYLDRENVLTVEKMRQREKEGQRQVFPGLSALEYLYTNTILDRKLTGKAKSASDYLVSLLKKESKEMTMYNKALAAIVLQGNGDLRTARTYLKSVVEHSVATEADGRYFDSWRAVSTWRNYTIPTQTAAIEALCRVGDTKGKDTIDEMRRWLLQQKRTQAWDTPINSINAIYAFLNGEQATLVSGEQATVSIDNRPLEMPKATAAMGYQKTAKPYEGEKQLTVTKTSGGTSWGSVYAQFMQNVTKIGNSGQGMKVKRELVLPKDGLKVGARIKVRITIDAERDMDFVEVIDRRASCMEPVRQLSGYRSGYYCVPKDNATCYFFDRLSKGRHVIETEYFIGREGKYSTGSCSAQCAYAPEFRSTTGAEVLEINK